MAKYIIAPNLAKKKGDFSTVSTNKTCPSKRSRKDKYSSSQKLPARPRKKKKNEEEPIYNRGG